MATDSNQTKDIRDRWDYHRQYWRENWAEGDIDMRYAAGDPWPAWEKIARNQAGHERPMLVYDECGQYIQEAINQLRANKRAVKVLPAPNIPGMPPGSDEEAQLRAARIRAIEYKWRAQSCYMIAAENAIRRGMGFWRIGKKRVSPYTFDQEITIKPIPNSRAVSLDPDAESPVWADMKDAFIFQTFTAKAFKERWPDASPTSFDLIDASLVGNWITGDNVQVAEYWCIKHKRRTLVRIKLFDGTEAEMFEDEFKQAGLKRDGKQLWKQDLDGYVMVGEIVRSERSDFPEVYQKLTNGLEILPNEQGEMQTEWDGKYIPIVPVCGPQYWVPTSGEGGVVKRVVESLVRKARDPIMTLCYIRSTQAELIGSAAKTPYVGYEGQFTDPNWEYANRSNIVKLEVPAVPDGAGKTLPLPSRQQIAFAVSELEMPAEAARRAIQAAMGLSSLPTSAQRRNEKSGVALRAIEEKQQQGRYHLVDALDMALVQSGRIISDLLPKLEDTPRDVQTRDDREETSVIRINEPYADEKTGEEKLNQFTDAEFDVIISTGPSFDTAREQASDFADLLLESQFGPRVADIAVKLKEIDPVIREEIANRLTPPDVAAAKEMGDVPPAAVQQIQQLSQALKAVNAHAAEVEKENQQLKAGIVAKQIDAQARIQEAGINAASRKEVALIQVQGKLQDEAMRQDAETARTYLQGNIDAKLADKQIEAAEEMRESEPEEPEDDA